LFLFCSGIFFALSYGIYITFDKESESYQKIVNVLSMSDKEFSEICKALNTELSGRILEYLEELELSGNVIIPGTSNQERTH
jgi:hypothetical protein